MSQHMKVHQLLEAAELAELEEYARDPARTVDQCLDWIVERDYAISRASVHRWKREFDSTDRYRAASETARAVLEAAAGKDAVKLSDAATEQLGQLLFEKFLSLQMQGEVNTKEIWAASMALKNLITSKRHFEKLKEDMNRTARQTVEEANKVARGGGDGEAVVAKVREILGVA